MKLNGLVRKLVLSSVLVAGLGGCSTGGHISYSLPVQRAMNQDWGDDHEILGPDVRTLFDTVAQMGGVRMRSSALDIGQGNSTYELMYIPIREENAILSDEAREEVFTTSDGSNVFCFAYVLSDGSEKHHNVQRGTKYWKMGVLSKRRDCDINSTVIRWRQGRGGVKKKLPNLLSYRKSLKNEYERDRDVKANVRQTEDMWSSLGFGDRVIDDLSKPDPDQYRDYGIER